MSPPSQPSRAGRSPAPPAAALSAGAALALPHRQPPNRALRRPPPPPRSSIAVTTTGEEGSTPVTAAGRVYFIALSLFAVIVVAAYTGGRVGRWVGGHLERECVAGWPRRAALALRLGGACLPSHLEAALPAAPAPPTAANLAVFLFQANTPVAQIQRCARLGVGLRTAAVAGRGARHRGGPAAGGPTGWHPRGRAHVAHACLCPAWVPLNPLDSPSGTVPRRPAASTTLCGTTVPPASAPPPRHPSTSCAKTTRG